MVNKPGEGVQMDVKYVYEQGGKRRYQFSVFDPTTSKYILRYFPVKRAKTLSRL